ncbi:MAG: sigma-70 family RNA polymerase sigma factor [Opitutus sp.]|nr:sigma-70 family RNA polymerase sigma factor [Opitutus sp.]
MNDDATLLRRYAEEGSESTFTELVRRHVDLVYGAALRRTGGDTHRAADVAQQVFTALAREARKLSHHAVLGAWLHTATRNAALNLMISEQRRQARELQALALEPAIAAGDASPDWDRLRPVIDAAIDELPEADRAAVVLRFLEQRAFAEIGAALHVSEDAARMRTDRALDKLRAALARRGITSTAAALGAIVSSQPVMSAPAGLAAVLATQSLATAGASAGLLVTLTSIMKLKIITTAALSALVFFGAGAYVGLTQSLDLPPPPPLETPRQSQAIASLRDANVSLKAEIDRLKADVDLLDAANAQLTAQRAARPPPVALPKTATLGVSIGQQQQSMLNNLRQLAAARDQFILENGRPPSSIHEIVGAMAYVRTVRTVGGEDYSALSMDPKQPMTITTPGGLSVTYDPASGNSTRPELSPAEQHAQELGRQIWSAADRAIEAYRVTHHGKDPPNDQATAPYFATPQEGADFLEYLKAKRAAGL